jgi:hypothetical protein
MHPNINQRRVRARIKLPKLADSIFYNQLRLEAAMIVSGWWRGWEAMTTDDNDRKGHVIPELRHPRSKTRALWYNDHRRHRFNLCCCCGHSCHQDQGVGHFAKRREAAGNGNKNNNNKNMNKGMRISMTSPATKGQRNFDTAGEQEDVRIRSSTMSLITYYHIVLIGLINMNKGLPVLF